MQTNGLWRKKSFIVTALRTASAPKRRPRAVHASPLEWRGGSHRICPRPPPAPCWCSRVTRRVALTAPDASLHRRGVKRGGSPVPAIQGASSHSSHHPASPPFRYRLGLRCPRHFKQPSRVLRCSRWPAAAALTATVFDGHRRRVGGPGDPASAALETTSGSWSHARVVASSGVRLAGGNAVTTRGPGAADRRVIKLTRSPLCALPPELEAARTRGNASHSARRAAWRLPTAVRRAGADVGRGRASRGPRSRDRAARG